MGFLWATKNVLALPPDCLESFLDIDGVLKNEGATPIEGAKEAPTFSSKKQKKSSMCFGKQMEVGNKKEQSGLHHQSSWGWGRESRKR